MCVCACVRVCVCGVCVCVQACMRVGFAPHGGGETGLPWRRGSAVRLCGHVVSGSAAGVGPQGQDGGLPQGTTSVCVRPGSPGVQGHSLVKQPFT